MNEEKSPISYPFPTEDDAIEATKFLVSGAISKTLLSHKRCAAHCALTVINFGLGVVAPDDVEIPKYKVGYYRTFAATNIDAHDEIASALAIAAPVAGKFDWTKLIAIAQAILQILAA